MLDHVAPGNSAYDDEIFGPVLSVARVDTYAEAVELVNNSPYGNGTAVFTNDGGAARRNSLFGDTHMHGTEGVHFYTRGKVVTSRWLDPSHGGVNLGFPVNA